MTDVLRVTDTATGEVVVHCGDLGERPVGKLLKWLVQVPIDVLIVPVGGYFTLGGDGALELARLLSPKAVIPCHAAEHGGMFSELASADLVLSRVPHNPLLGAIRVSAATGWMNPERRT
jgi:L-ascorbate metabolism protein UlaG (beta-lactamase superfamily)